MGPDDIAELEPLEPSVASGNGSSLRFDPAAPLLSVEHLGVEFKTDDGMVHAVDDVSFSVSANEVLGIVGESGSGKSVTAMAILGLLPKSARITGSVRFRGVDLIGRKEKELQPIRGARIAMIFQDALASLNPVFKVGDQIGEAIRVHNKVSDRELRERVVELLDLVGISQPRSRADQYPHEYSGGMRQRAMIAMSIANDPEILIADEPTTALDVTIQAQVMEVLERIQDRTESSILLITHDLGVVAGVADRVMVMYAGRQAELGSVDQIFYESRHPYTLGLLASLPRLDRLGARTQRLHRIKGQPPSLIFVPTGCPFHPRCPAAVVPGLCNEVRPAFRVIGAMGQLTACHFAEGLDREALLAPEEATS